MGSEYKKWHKKPNLYPFLLALMPVACTTTKLDKDFWLNVLRCGLKNLDAVLNTPGREIRDFFIKQGQGLSAPAAPPYPNIC